MASVSFKGGVFERREDESVLDCLLRHGQFVPYACRAGMCQACLVKAEAGEPGENASKWIKPALRARGYTLACQWVPEGDVAVGLPAVEDFSVALRLDELSSLNARVLRLRLRPLEPGSLFPYAPGQYLSLINPEGVARSYSIASDFEREGFVELHVAATAHGAFSGWLFREARPGALLHARGPAGDCFYRPQDEQDQPLLLAATGTGLAPLFGILRAALRQGHGGPITLVHGGRRPADLYYGEELAALQATHPQFRYRPCVLEGADACPGAALQQVSAEDLAAACVESASAARTQAYLCGAPAFVHGLHRRLFLKGIRPGNIHCDPFLERSVAAASP